MVHRRTMMGLFPLAASLVALSLFVAFLHSSASGGLSAPRARMTLTIQPSGYVSARLEFDNPLAVYAPGDHKTSGAFILGLPFEYAEHWVIRPPSDMLVAPIVHGRGYTLLAVAPTAETRQTVLNIDRIGILSRTMGGHSQLRIDNSYYLAPPEQQQLLRTSSSIAKWTFIIILPQEYEESDIRVSGASYSLLDRQTLSLNPVVLAGGFGSSVTVTFPDSAGNVLQRAEALIGFAFGWVLVIMEAATDVRKWARSRLFAGAIVSMAALVLAGYYSISLREGSALIAVAGLSAPSALYLIASYVYLALIAPHLEATITGQVTFGQNPLQRAQVVLESHGPSGWKAVARVEHLDAGSYEFHPRILAPGRYRVKAQAGATQQATSHPFAVRRGDKPRNIPSLDLHV